METTKQETIDLLNNLLEINNDRIEGYKHAIKETNESDLKILFQEFERNSMKCKQELTAEIQNLGGTPIEGTRTTGKLYRAWMDIKAALTNKDRKTILNSCEMGEDVAVKNYEDACKNDSIGYLHDLITNQYALIKEDHNKIKILRDNLVTA